VNESLYESHPWNALIEPVKALRPGTIVTLGPALLGVVQGVATWLLLPGSRRVSDIAWAILIGAAFGLVIFGPIAAAVVTRERCPDWFERHTFRIHWYASAAMGLSLGYLFACFRHEVFDGLAIVAFLSVCLGAVVKIALSLALNQEVPNAG
jgi:hypothetical protein